MNRLGYSKRVEEFQKKGVECITIPYNEYIKLRKNMGSFAIIGELEEVGILKILHALDGLTPFMDSKELDILNNLAAVLEGIQNN